MNYIQKFSRSITLARRCAHSFAFFGKEVQGALTGMKVLDTMVENYSQINPNSLKRTAVVCVQHSLVTVIPLWKSMFQLGLSPQNSFCLGKRYSANNEAENKMRSYGVNYLSGSEQVGLGRFSESFTRDINRLWATVENELLDRRGEVDNIIVLDHGGEANKFVPFRILETFNVVGVEKTTAGLAALQKKDPLFPIINVATCMSKLILESPLIAEAVMEKLAPFINLAANEPTECGVIGYGAIGREIANKLLEYGHRVIIYDKNSSQLAYAPSHQNLVTTNDLSSLVNFSKLIFGCSGADVTQSLDAFRLAPANKILISCSSEDREFLSLLLATQQKYNGKGRVIANSFKDVVYTNAFQKEITILRAGFPYNFDLSGLSVPANDIQFTRALVLASVFQAIDFLAQKQFRDSTQLFALDGKLQKYVVKQWLQCLSSEKKAARYSNDTLEKFESVSWINQNSRGCQASVSFDLSLSTDSTIIPRSNY